MSPHNRLFCHKKNIERQIQIWSSQKSRQSITLSKHQTFRRYFISFKHLLVICILRIESSQNDYGGNCGKLVIISGRKYLSSKKCQSLEIVEYFPRTFISSEQSKVSCSKIRVVRDMAGYMRCKQLLWRANCQKSKFTGRLLHSSCVYEWVCQEQIGSEDSSEIVYYRCTEVLLCCKVFSEGCCFSGLKHTLVLLLQGYGCALDLPS